MELTPATLKVECFTNVVVDFADGETTKVITVNVVDAAQEANEASGRHF